MGLLISKACPLTGEHFVSIEPTKPYETDEKAGEIEGFGFWWPADSI